MNINERIYRNAKALSKINGKDLREVERAIGHTPGFLSRKTTKLDVEELVKLSEIFEVGAEELMGGDFEHDLELKNAIDGLRSAVITAKQYFTEDGIMNVIRPLFLEDEK